jgi:hypothetical protein
MNAMYRSTALTTALAVTLAFGSVGCFGDIFGSDNDVLAEESFQFGVDVTTQTRLSVVGKNGSILVTGTSGTDSVLITGVRQVWSDDLEDAEARLEDLEVVVDEQTEVISVTTVQPADTEGRSYVVEYEISVPDDLVVAIVDGNGSITVLSVNSAVSIINGNGNIVLDEIVGSVSVELGNGGIDAEMTLPLDGTVALIVGNGSIGLAIPESTSAMFSANVGNGGINVLGLDLQDVVATSRSLTGRLGDGRGSISLISGNGNVAAVGF